MLFSLEEDQGSRIRCYLIPDSGGATPALRLSSQGQEIARVEANNARPEIVAAGRHATGLCGFDIDETIVPDLSARDDLELRDSETGLLIYRRSLPNFLRDTKVFRLETHLLPLRRFDEAIEDRFQGWYHGLDRYGLETMTQSFILLNNPSRYVSGRMQFQTIEVHLRDFQCFVMLRDPFLELAERLLVLKNLPEGANEVLGERDLMTFKVVSEYLHGFEELDDRFCKNFAKRTPEAVLKVLANPIVRQLASNEPEEVPKKNALAAALQALSTFDVVGTRDEAEMFSHGVQDCLGLDQPLPVMREHQRVRELGEALRQLGKVEMLLEYDLEVFEHVKRAFASAQVGTRVG